MFSRDMPSLSITAMSSHQERTYVNPGLDGFQSTAAGALVIMSPVVESLQGSFPMVDPHLEEVC